MIDQDKKKYISKRFNAIVFDRFKIKFNEMTEPLLSSCIEISDRWSSVPRFNPEDKWHQSLIDSIINSRLDTLEPLLKK
jgi:hypothetical protein